MSFQKIFNKSYLKYFLFYYGKKSNNISRTCCILVNHTNNLPRKQTTELFSQKLSSSKFTSVACEEAETSAKFEDLKFEQSVPHEELLVALRKCSSVSEQMETLAKTLTLPPHDLENRGKFCRVMENIFKPFFKDFKIQIFGSTVNSFGFRGCDMDMTFETSSREKSDINFFDPPDLPLVSEVLSGKVSIEQLSELPVKDKLHFMHNVLLEYYKESSDAPIFINAHVPLVRFHYDKYNLKCDLTFENKVAYANTKLLYLFAKLDKRVVPLMMTLRYWAKHVELIGKGLMFNTYTISLLVVYFLQSRNPPILPSAEYVMSLSKESFEIKDMSDTSFLNILETLPPSENTETLDTLLKEFFTFYLFFDFTRVICPLTAKAVAREEFFTPDRSKRFKMNTVCVQDPMCETHNVADLVDFKHCKKLSNELLRGCLVTDDPHSTAPSTTAPWGIMNVFDSPEDFQAKGLLKRRHFSIRLSPAPPSATANRILEVLRRALLIECRPVDPRQALALLATQDAYIAKKKQEADLASALRSELANMRRRHKKSEAVRAEDCFPHDEGPAPSVVDQFRKCGSEDRLVLVAECRASCNTWVGRNAIECGDHGPCPLEVLLERERAKSEMVAKQNGDGFAEKVKPLEFLCEFYAPRDSPDASLVVVLRPLQRLTFNPVLGIFLKRYLSSVMKHLNEPDE